MPGMRDSMKKKLLLLGSMIISMLFCVSCKSQEQKVTEQMELAEKYLLDGNYEEAVVAFQKVLEIEPRSIAAYTGLVKVYDEIYSMRKRLLQLNWEKQYCKRMKRLIVDRQRYSIFMQVSFMGNMESWKRE